MPKDIPQPVNPPAGANNREDEASRNEPLAGSKRVKNANHSRHNNGEG